MIKAISVSTTDCENESYLEHIKQAGFEGVDLGFGKEILPALAEDRYEKKIEELRGKLEKHGLVCAQVHLPYYDLFVSGELYDEEIEHQIKHSFHAMKLLGAQWGALHPMSSTNFDYDETRAMKDNTEKIKRYAEWAERQGVGIAVENIPIFPDCPQYRFFTSDYKQHCELVDQLDLDNVKICWDFGHSNLMDYEIEKVIAYVGDRIKIVHLHNNYGNLDMHLCPAIGTVDWDTVMPALKRSGFSGPLALEINMNIVKEEYREDYLNFCGKTADRLLRKF